MKRALPTPLNTLLFWTLWKEKNKRPFENIEQLSQVIKSSFMCIFLDQVRVYIDDYSLTMIGFVDWLGNKGTEVVFYLIVFLFAFQLVLIVCIM